MTLHWLLVFILGMNLQYKRDDACWLIESLCLRFGSSSLESSPTLNAPPLYIETLNNAGEDIVLLSHDL
jgi:hypothetical protein